MKLLYISIDFVMNEKRARNYWLTLSVEYRGGYFYVTFNVFNVNSNVQQRMRARVYASVHTFKCPLFTI